MLRLGSEFYSGDGLFNSIFGDYLALHPSELSDLSPQLKVWIGLVNKEGYPLFADLARFVHRPSRST